MCAHTGRKKTNKIQKPKEKKIWLSICKETQLGCVCVQQEMPVKKEDEAWLLDRSLHPELEGPVGDGACLGNRSQSDPDSPVSDQVDNTPASRLLARLTAQGNPLKTQGGDEATVPGRREEG